MNEQDLRVWKGPGPVLDSSEDEEEEAAPRTEIAPDSSEEEEEQEEWADDEVCPECGRGDRQAEVELGKQILCENCDDGWHM